MKRYCVHIYKTCMTFKDIQNTRGVTTDLGPAIIRLFSSFFTKPWMKQLDLRSYVSNFRSGTLEKKDLPLVLHGKTKHAIIGCNRSIRTFPTLRLGPLGNCADTGLLT